MAVAPHLPRAARPVADPAAIDRRIVPRRGLPGGRAIAGGLLVSVAALGTFAAVVGDGRGHTRPVVVAARDVPPGSVLGPDDLAVETGDVPRSVAAAVFSNVDDVVGAVVTGPLSEGELVQAGTLADGTDGALPTLSVALEPSAADGGALVSGDIVQVLATYGSDATAETVAVSERARVVTVAGGAEGLGESGQLVVRLALASSEERSAVVHASVAGRLALVRTTGVSTPSVEARYRAPVDAAGTGDDAAISDGDGR